MRRPLRAVVVALLLLLAGCSTEIPGRAAVDPAWVPTFTLSGSFELWDSAVEPDCIGSGGYDDIRAGTSIVVSDQAGDVVGVGALGVGEWFQYVGCSFAFEVEGVPAGLPFYEVEVSHRGAVTFSAAEVAADQVRLSLGE